MRYNIPNDDTGSGVVSDARYWGSTGGVITLNDPIASGADLGLPDPGTNPVF